MLYLNFVNCNPEIKNVRFQKGNRMPALPESLYRPIDELKGTLVLGFEEWEASDWVRDLNTGIESTNILVTRDLRDIFASRLARLEEPQSTFNISEETLRKWGTWMTSRDENGRFNMLNHYEKYWPLPPNTTVINFENWLSNPEYRKSSAKRLGIQYSDLGMKSVSNHGGGSSFGGPPKAGESRWKRFEDHPLMIEFIDQYNALSRPKHHWQKSYPYILE